MLALKHLGLGCTFENDSFEIVGVYVLNISVSFSSAKVLSEHLWDQLKNIVIAFRQISSPYNNRRERKTR